MNAELVKRQDRWDLYGEDGSKIASSAPNPFNKLSIKNCEAIANGYDLDDLAEKEYPDIEEIMGVDISDFLQSAYIKGAKAIIEILGDKKFSEEDLKLAYSSGWTQSHNAEGSYYGMQKEFIQSLQQTEWMVSSNPDEKDSDGCLILRRK